MDRPFFSIVVPAFNYANYLPKAIDSVLSQSLQDFEILISDDCSTDNTEEVIQDRYGNDPRISYWKNEQNLGSQKNVNLCYQKAKGVFVNYLQADDYYTEDTYLQTAANTLQANPAIDFYYTAGKFITNDGHVARTYQPFFQSWTAPGIEHFATIARQPPWPTFIFAKTKLLQSIGGEIPDLKVADFELTMRLCLASLCHFEVSSKVASRVHSDAQGMREGYDQPDKVCTNNLQCLDHFLANHDQNPRAREIVLSARALYASGLRKHNQSRFNEAYLKSKLEEDSNKWIHSRKRIVIYCSGEHTRKLLDWTNIYEANIVGIVDANPSLQGSRFLGYEIRSPHEILSFSPDLILISSATMPDEIALSLRHIQEQNVQVYSPYPLGPT